MIFLKKYQNGFFNNTVWRWKLSICDIYLSCSSYDSKLSIGSTDDWCYLPTVFGVWNPNFFISCSHWAYYFAISGEVQLFLFVLTNTLGSWVDTTKNVKLCRVVWIDTTKFGLDWNESQTKSISSVNFLSESVCIFEVSN